MNASLSPDATTAELAALRAAAGLVAAGASPTVVLETVARHVAAALSPSYLEILQFERANQADVIAAWAVAGGRVVDIDRWQLHDDGLARSIARTKAPARQERRGSATKATSGGFSITSSVGVPIMIGDQVWGALFVHSVEDRPLPSDTELRLMGFTELISSVVANSRAQAQFLELAAVQAALLRVAELVARGVPPEQVFAAVAEELGRVVDVQGAKLLRYDSDNMATFLATWGPLEAGIPTGTRLSSEGTSVTGRIRATGLPARIDDYSAVVGAIGEIQKSVGMKSAAGAPISVRGRLWGAVIVGSVGETLLPPGTEERMERFAALIAVAITNLETRVALETLAKEQAALRAVATMVAREEWATMPPTIIREIGQLLEVDGAFMLRYEDEETATILAGWGTPDLANLLDVKVPFAGDNPVNAVWQTRRPARRYGWIQADGPLAELARQWGATSVVASPVIVENHIWGAIAVVSTESEPLPRDTEERVGQFGDLVATAIGNMKSRLELVESRTRIVHAADNARRRFERDLHDGIQQRLVSVAMGLRPIEDGLPDSVTPSRSELSLLADKLNSALDDLRELSRGLHPAILTEGGLGPALRSLCRRAVVPTTLELDELPRLDEAIEVAVYYVVSEALANVTKHAHASKVELSLRLREGELHAAITDDGVGGADMTQGSGLVGLDDRVRALGGSLTVRSGEGLGTTISARLPANES